MNRIEYILLLLIGFVINLFPLKFAQRAAKFWGVVIYYLIPIRKKIALINLSLCFPEKDEKWKLKVIKSCYQNVLLTLTEILCIPKILKKGIDNIFESIDYEELFDGVRNNKGTILVSCHFSNWELSALAISRFMKYPINVIVKTQSNLFVDKKLNEYRVLTGNNMIPIGNSLREIPKGIKENNVFAFLVDQSAPEGYSHFVNFFGNKVSSFSGPSKYTLKYGCELVFGYIVRKENLKFDLITKKIDTSSLNGDDSIKLTQIIQNMVENLIKEYPEQWLWFHRRFKHILNQKSPYAI